MTIQAIDSLTAVGMFGLGTPELIIIAVVLVLLFGARRIPELGKSVGEGIRNFKKGLAAADRDDEEEDAKALDADDVPVLEADDAKRSKLADSKAEAKKEKAE